MPGTEQQQQQHQQARPPQHQNRQPGVEHEMTPAPEAENTRIQGSQLLQGKVALITGGDSGIGKAVAIAFAREGAKITIAYLEEETDALETARLIQEKGGECLMVRCDVSNKASCEELVDNAIGAYGRLDILVNNAAEQHPRASIDLISEAQLLKTFQTNIFSMFYLSAAAIPHLGKSESPAIINTASVTAYRGSPALLDYSATKGAVVTFTRSLARQLMEKGIRVNGVAPGPIWTPLIASTFPADEVAEFGADSPMGRAGEPWECAECYVFLASAGSSYMTGQFLHPNGGEIING